MENLNISTGEMVIETDNSLTRLELLNALETKALVNNCKIISKNYVTFELVYEIPGIECNHLLHGLISLFTLVWVFAWIYIATTTIEPRRVGQRVERNLTVTTIKSSL